MAEEISFSLIDAKEGEVVGIRDNPYGRSENKHNALLMIQAEAEYLNGLLELQTQIKKKYEPQLIENNPVDGEEDLDDVNSKGLLKDGADNLYYT